MQTESSLNTVAIYWDFENLHATLFERDWGYTRSYGEPRNRYASQNVLINVKAVTDYAAGIGDIAINRAYNNWQWFSRYSDAVNRAGIDLIQIYPKGSGGKNGADIRLALDVLDDVTRYPKITHVIVISNDSDFISLAQKLKQLGLTVIGIGVQQKTNLYWAQTCDEFRDYDTLLGIEEEARATPAEPDEDEEPSVKALTLEEARALMLDALRRLVAQKGTERIARGSLKMMMKRMNPTFDESSFGFLNFASFLKAFSDVVEDIPDDSGGQVRLRDLSEQPESKGRTDLEGQAPTEQDYELILKRGNVRLLPYPWWHRAIEIVDAIFRDAPQQQVTSFDDLEGELAVILENEGLDADPELVHRLRGFLFALWQFQLKKGDKTIGLKRFGGDTLLDCVQREIVRRIVKYAAPPVDMEKIAKILYGEDAAGKSEYVTELVKRFDRNPA